MLLSSGKTSSKMEQQEGNTSSVPGEIRGDVRPLMPNRRGGNPTFIEFCVPDSVISMLYVSTHFIFSTVV